MKFKFNWGTGITIFILLFISFYIFLIFLTKSKSFDMVTKDYYPESIIFEDQIKKTRQAKALGESIDIQINNDTLIIKLPAWKNGSSASGTFDLYRPGNANNDVSINIKVNSRGIQKVYPSGLVSGRYVLKADWEINDVGYYDEISLFVP